MLVLLNSLGNKKLIAKLVISRDLYVHILTDTLLSSAP